MKAKSENDQITRHSFAYWIFTRQRSLQILLFLIIVTSVAVGLVPVEFQKRIVNTAIRVKNIDALYSYCAIYFGAVVISSLFKYLINILQSIVGQRILAVMRNKRQLSKSGVSSHISFITQNPYIFAGSICSNLLHGCESLRRVNGNGKRKTVYLARSLTLGWILRSAAKATRCPVVKNRK